MIDAVFKITVIYGFERAEVWFSATIAHMIWVLKQLPCSIESSRKREAQQ